MIYVINLKRAEDRREHMRNLLDDLGMEYTFVEAVDGNSLDPKTVPGYDELRRKKLMGSILTPNQLACSLSHISVFRKIAQSTEPYHLVMEDDLLFEPELKSTLESISLIQLPWDHIRFGGLRKRRFVSRQILPNGVEVGYYTGPVWGAEGYALTPAGARKLLAYRNLQLYIVDQAMERFWENHLISLGVYPFQLRQAEEEHIPSTIGYDPGFEAERSRAQHRNLRRRFRRAIDSIHRRWYNARVRGILWDPPRRMFRSAS